MIALKEKVTAIQTPPSVHSTVLVITAAPGDLPRSAYSQYQQQASAAAAAARETPERAVLRGMAHDGVNEGKFTSNPPVCL